MALLVKTNIIFVKYIIYFYLLRNFTLNILTKFHSHIVMTFQNGNNHLKKKHIRTERQKQIYMKTYVNFYTSFDSEKIA